MERARQPANIELWAEEHCAVTVLSPNMHGYFHVAPLRRARVLYKILYDTCGDSDEQP